MNFTTTDWIETSKALPTEELTVLGYLGPDMYQVVLSEGVWSYADADGECFKPPSHWRLLPERPIKGESESYQSWTDASKELPAEDVEVLIVLYRDSFLGTYSEGTWYFDYGEEAYGPISYWQHLPPPPTV